VASPHSDSLLPRATHPVHTKASRLQHQHRHEPCRVVGPKRCGLCNAYVRGHPSTHCPPPSTLAYRLSPSSLLRALVSFNTPFTLLCQSWQTTNQRSPPRYPHRPLSRLSTKCVLRPPDVNAALTTDFPVLQLPVLYVVRSSLLLTDVVHVSDRPATSSSQQIVVYAVVIFAIWNIPAVRNVINPLKLFTIGWHELCHIIVVSVLHPGVYYQDVPFLNVFVALVGYPDWRNDNACLYRSKCWWMHQS